MTFSPLSVLSIYDSMFLGGARIAHTEMVTALHRNTDEFHSVVSLTDRVVRESTLQNYYDSIPYRRLQEAGVPTVAFNREGDHPMTADDIARVQKLVDGNQVIVSLKEQPLPFLTEVDFGGKPFFVSLHRSDPENQGEGVAELLKLCEAGVITKAVCCAESSRKAYEGIGVPEDKLVVIPNGVDLSRFFRSPLIRDERRNSMGIPADSPVVMLAARFDEMKNVGLFVEAASIFSKLHADAHFLLCGAGMTEANPAFEEMVRENFDGRFPRFVHGLGIQSGMNSLYNAADIVSLTSSFAEAYPLCLVEGMAAGAVPVTTPAGDSALIVRDERLVTTLKAEDVASKWSQAFEDRREHRARILLEREDLSDQSVFQKFAKLFESVR